jgi:hypothetical protein
MKKIYTVLITYFTFIWLSQAQTSTVVFDYEKASLNDNQPLPAEKNFSITGSVSSQYSMVEVLVYDRKSRGKKPPLYQNIWKRSIEKPNAGQFYLPVNYKLRGNDEYDFSINFYRTGEANEVVNLRNDLLKAIEAYLQQNLISGKGTLSIRNSATKMLNDLNTLVKNSLVLYKNQAEITFEGFSDLVKDKLQMVEKHSLGAARKLFLNKSKEEAAILQRTQYLAELQLLITKEVSYLTNTGIHVLADTKFIENVSTEKTPNFLTIHAGYSGTGFYEKDYKFFSNFNAGITIPWGNPNFARGFWRKSALVAGVYFQNFKAGNEEISGPIIGRPLYAGVGYKFVPFVRLIGGITVLETGKGLDNGAVSQFPKDIYVKPFVGLVVDIDIWFNLRK